MIRALIAVLVGCTAALCGACDRPGDSASASGERLTACRLVTRDEASEVLGGPVTTPDRTANDGADALAGRSGCAWATTDDRAAALLELVRTADMSPSVRRTGFSATARFNAAVSRHPDAPKSDVGDRGFWVEEEAKLYVLRRDAYLVIEVAGPSRDVKEIAADLAERAVTRLDRWPRAD